jgi:hypothetical protein
MPRYGSSNIGNIGNPYGYLGESRGYSVDPLAQEVLNRGNKKSRLRHALMLQNQQHQQRMEEQQSQSKNQSLNHQEALVMQHYLQQAAVAKQQAFAVQQMRAQIEEKKRQEKIIDDEKFHNARFGQSDLEKAIARAQIEQAKAAEQKAFSDRQIIPSFKYENALKAAQAISQGRQPEGAFDYADAIKILGPQAVTSLLKEAAAAKGKTDTQEIASKGKAATQELNQQKVEIGVKKKVEDEWDKAKKANPKLKNAGPEYIQWFKDSAANRLYPEKYAPPPQKEPPSLLKKSELDEFGMPKPEALTSETGNETSPFKLATVNYDDAGNVIPSVGSGVPTPNVNPGGDNIIPEGDPRALTGPPAPAPTLPPELPPPDVGAWQGDPTFMNRMPPEDNSWTQPETPPLATNQWTPPADDEEKQRQQEILMAYLGQYQDQGQQDNPDYYG